MKLPLAMLALAAVPLFAQETAMSIPLRLVPASAHEADIREVEPGVYEVHTTGGDPYVFTEPLTADYDHRQIHALACEMFCPAGIDAFQVFYGPPKESHSATVQNLAKSETWATVSVLLEHNWDQPYRTFRLDFGHHGNVDLRIRNIHLRPPTAEERRIAAEREAKRQADRELAALWRSYLATDYPGTIDTVAVDRERVRLHGTAPEPAVLREIPMYFSLDHYGEAPVVQALPAGRFDLVLPRFPTAEADRAYSRWVLTKPDSPVLLSHARYATDTDGMAPADAPAKLTPKSIKGLGGVGYIPSHIQDLADLGVHNITCNILLQSLFAPEAGEGTFEHTFQGHTFHVRQGALAGYDNLLTFCSQHDIVVSAILLIGRGGSEESRRIWQHPDCCDPGIYTMANVTSAEGVLHYAAAVDILASRYCRADAKYGRIANWIIHNEVDAGWVWTNAGEKELETYLDLYQRSLRTVYLTVRQYDPHGRPFVSLTHAWTENGAHFYKPKDLLLLLRDFGQREGDFEWAVAYHPYPQNLFNARSWNDTRVNDTFDTPLITFRNLEVIDRWLVQPDFLYQGKPRGLIFSEQGPNSRTLSEEDQRVQAASMVYFWRKAQRLKALEGFQNHRWIDHAQEGGLLLGLRAFAPGTISSPGERKQVWYVFQALGTPEEAEKTAFAAPIIGVKSLDEIQ